MVARARALPNRHCWLPPEVTHLLENWRGTRNTWQFEREDRGLILGPLRLAVGAVRRTKLLGLDDVVSLPSRKTASIAATAAFGAPSMPHIWSAAALSDCEIACCIEGSAAD
jgi:hypothetical protein